MQHKGRVCVVGELIPELGLEVGLEEDGRGSHVATLVTGNRCSIVEFYLYSRDRANFCEC